MNFAIEKCHFVFMFLVESVRFFPIIIEYGQVSGLGILEQSLFRHIFIKWDLWSVVYSWSDDIFVMKITCTDHVYQICVTFLATVIARSVQDR